MEITQEEKILDNRINIIQEYVSEIETFISVAEDLIKSGSSTSYESAKMMLEIRDQQRNLEIQKTFLKDWKDHKENIWKPTFIKESLEVNQKFDSLIIQAKAMSDRIEKVKGKDITNSLKLVLEKYDEEPRDQSDKNKHYRGVIGIMNSAKKAFR